MPFQHFGIKLLKFILLSVALVETFTGSVIECIVYTADVDSPTSILQYCIGAYYLPNKHIYKFIVVLYVPALCLWRVRRRSNAVKNGDECNDLQTYRLKPAALVCRQIFHVVLYVGNVPGYAVSQALYSRRLHIWLRWFSSPLSRWKVNGKPLGQFYFADKELSGNELCPGDELEELAGDKLCPGDELVLSSEILTPATQTDEEPLESRDQPDHLHQQFFKQYNSTPALIRILPWKLISRVYGRIHSCYLPVWPRLIVLRVYIWLFGCNIHEANVQDLKEYNNLSEFFRRSLRDGVRPINHGCDLTSPTDGTMVYCGVVAEDCLEQVKGVNYSMAGFLGPRTKLFGFPANQVESPMKMTVDKNDLIWNNGNCLHQCVIYLSPGDYHRFHSPADWTILGRRHFPGELFSVSPSLSRWVQGLFNFNERALYVGQWQHGFFSMTAVGATLVGSINVYFDETLSTNIGARGHSWIYNDESFQESGLSLSKGEAMGEFRLGSTIVLLFEAPVDFKFSVNPGQRVKYGCGLSTTANSS